MLIVDDEEHVREGIDLAVDWDKFGITKRLHAEEGQQALDMIRLYKPAVMFCDMSMPGMDGMELLRLLREEGWDTQVIVVSGYDDYQYTRAAVRANGLDYLLKPFSKSELEQVLEQAVMAYKHKEVSLVEEREAGFRIKWADALVYEQKLASFFKEESVFQEGLRGHLYKIGLPAERLRVAIILPCNRMELVERRYGGDRELFIFAINNIAHETFRPYGAHYLCRLDDYQWVLVAAFAKDSRGAEEHRRCMEKAAAAWRETVGLETLIGICQSEADAAGITGAVGKARSTLLKSVIWKDSRQEAASGEPPRLMDQQFLLQTALDTGNKAYAAEIIRSFVERLRKWAEIRLKDLQACTIEANLLLEWASRLLHHGKETADLLMPLWISDLDEWERTFIRHWWALMEEQGRDGLGNRGMEAIREYIERHFQKDLSLSVLSERFHFSPQYIAKKFKELHNTTVMTYLTDIRMDKAKSLLRFTNKPVSEIANSLGYDDENYFGKVFKKQNGISPLQYRKQQ
ncbi:response regulator [Paenibacillus sp. BR2-3]|uniref:response regulator transcription factor n=1 Tax=Paenibacillus sp. BR2-3 TaxID=3048494 RepID=UPI0039778C7D